MVDTAVFLKVIWQINIAAFAQARKETSNVRF